MARSGSTSRDIVSVNDVLAPVEVKPFGVCGVWRVGDGEVCPFAGLYSSNSAIAGISWATMADSLWISIPLLQGHDSGTLWRHL